MLAETAPGGWLARPLSHRVPTVGYQLTEPDGRRMRPDRLAALASAGRTWGGWPATAAWTWRAGRVSLDEVSEPRPGQRFAFIMDTRLCDNAFALAEGADLIVCEATFLDDDAELAPAFGHLTARQAGQIAAECGVRTLVLSHFSQRYAHQDPRRFADEAGAVFGGEIVVAADLDRVPVPSPARVTPSLPLRPAVPRGAGRRPAGVKADAPLARPSGPGRAAPSQRTVDRCQHRGRRGRPCARAPRRCCPLPTSKSAAPAEGVTPFFSGLVSVDGLAAEGGRLPAREQPATGRGQQRHADQQDDSRLVTGTADSADRPPSRVSPRK